MALPVSTILDFASGKWLFALAQDALSNVMSRVSLDSTMPTYRASAVGIAPGATPADFLIIGGSASKTVRIKRIEMNGVATAAGTMPVQLVRRSTAATGGTPVTTPIATNDSSAAVAPAATAVVKHYTSANTPGTAVPVQSSGAGALHSTRFIMDTTATGKPPPTVLFDGRTSGQALVLRGASDFLAVNFAGGALTSGAAWDYTVEWEEDAS